MQAPQTGLESDFGRSPTISDPLDAEDLRETLLGFKRRLPLVIGLTLFFGWFTWNKVPETRGKTIAQVTKEFEKY